MSLLQRANQWQGKGFEKMTSDMSSHFKQFEDGIRVDERERVLLAIQDCVSEGLLSDDLLANLNHFLNVRYNER